MDLIWFIEMNGQQEGPYSIDDLALDRRITPDTLVWREGFEQWVPIRNVRELDEIFEEDPVSESDEDDNEEGDKPKNGKRKKLPLDPNGKEEIALNLQNDFPPILWLLLFLLLMSYLMYWIYGR